MPNPTYSVWDISDERPFYLVLFLPAVLSDCLSDQIYEFWAKQEFIKNSFILLLQTKGTREGYGWYIQWDNSVKYMFSVTFWIRQYCTSKCQKRGIYSHWDDESLNKFSFKINKEDYSMYIFFKSTHQHSHTEMADQTECEIQSVGWGQQR